jgi:two-component sensor histidine kinase
LSATDDLIMATQGRGASIRNILSTELGAYEMSRIAMEGPDVFLSPKLAMTMALLVHELATNAAKYGSLSNPVGKLSIYWSLSAATLSLEWREKARLRDKACCHAAEGSTLRRPDCRELRSPQQA